MSNSSSDSSDNQTDRSEEALAGLWCRLCPEDHDEAGRRYIKLHQKLAAMARIQIRDSASAADITLDRLGKRILDGVEIVSIEAYAVGILRLVVFEIKRSEDHEVSSEKLEYEPIVIDENPDEELRTTLMKRCIQQLPIHEQELLKIYYAEPSGRARSKRRSQLAKRNDRTVAALRIHVTRLRRGLKDCVNELMKRI